MDNIYILKRAELEYQQAYQWYQNRNQEAADNFESAFQQGLEAISQQPEIFTPLDQIYRYYLLEGFPYQLIYRIQSQQRIVIVTVAHTSRKPGYWRSR